MPKQILKDVSELDEDFKKYLKKAQAYDKLTQERQIIRDEMKKLEKKISPLLNKMEAKKQNFNINTELCDVYGNCIGLKLVFSTPRILNKDVIYESLCKFYCEKFISHKKEDLKKFAEASTAYIWENRPQKPTKPTVKTVYHKDASKKKKKNQEEDEEDDEDDEDDEE